MSPKWIKCSDRMPALEESVLCWLPSRMQACEVLWLTDLDDPQWEGRAGFYGSKDVTHWMPLPEEPE